MAIPRFKFLAIFEVSWNKIFCSNPVLTSHVVGVYVVVAVDVVIVMVNFVVAVDDVVVVVKVVAAVDDDVVVVETER